jgi:hypothetical protein
MTGIGRRVTRVALTTAVLAAVAFSFVWAQQTAPAPAARPPAGIDKPLPALPTTDVAVDDVAAFGCKCFEDLGTANAAMVGKVRVVVKLVPPGIPSAGKVRIEFRNLSTGQTETMEQPFAQFGGPSQANVKPVLEFNLGHKLVQKSPGIKVTVTTQLNDSAPANNVKQWLIATCGPLVL